MNIRAKMLVTKIAPFTIWRFANTVPGSGRASADTPLWSRSQDVAFDLRASDSCLRFCSLQRLRDGFYGNQVESQMTWTLRQLPSIMEKREQEFKGDSPDS